MRLGIMQPYVFPYLGYYQLVAAVDQFVFFDDVNFIRKGWINRNTILVNNQKHTFSIPLHKVSQNQLIKDTYLSNEYQKWQRKFAATLRHTYAQAPFFTPAYSLIMDILTAKHDSISNLAIQSIESVFRYAGGSTTFSRSSALNYNRNQKGQEKILEICRLFSATEYANLPGGKALYKPEAFQKEGMELLFIEPEIHPYKQQGSGFISHLSIIDVLMYNSPAALQEMFTGYKLLQYSHSHG